MYSHHQQGEEDLKKSIVWVSCSEIIKKLEYTKTIGQGGLFNISKVGYIFQIRLFKTRR